MALIQVQLHAKLVHVKAQSACCAAPLDRVREGAEEFTCRQCGEPTERAEGPRTEVTANG